MQRTRRLTAMLALIGCTLFAATRAEAQYPPPSNEGAAIAQVRAGDALMSQGQYAAAAQQYEAAYAIDPVLPILERMAQAYRLAGDNARATMLYQQIAVARGQVPPPQPYAAPAPTYVAPSPLPPPVYYTRTVPARKPGQGLINAGTALLISGYGVALVGGAITMGATYSLGGDSSWYGAGGMLFIPIAGPFATIAYESHPYWAVPWAIIDGGLQLAGLSLLIAGAAVRAQHKTAPAKPATAFNWNLSPYSNQQGGGLVLSGRF